jgi:hypothetical protein
VTDDEERELKQELLMSDVRLRRKQEFWETPRNIAILLGAVAGLTAAGAGFLGFKLGQIPPPPPIIINIPAATK